MDNQEKPSISMEFLGEFHACNLILKLEEMYLQFAMMQEGNETKKLTKEEINEFLLDKGQPVNSVPLSQTEISNLINALQLSVHAFDAQKFIRDSVCVNLSSEKRWSKVAEIMGFKVPGVPIKKRGYKNYELWRYMHFLSEGLSANEAAEKVKPLFKFPSQEACNTWIYNEIKKHKETENVIFANLPRPQKSIT